MLKQSIVFDDITNLNVLIWGPETEEEVKGVIQIAHGMAEHIGRYEKFAEELADNGYVVVGCDLYAHGLTAGSPEKVGVITRYDFCSAIIKSIKIIHDEVLCRFDDLPKILFAHSMSSMVAQRYIEIYPTDFNKVILSGTDAPTFKYKLSKCISKLFMSKKQIKYSKFIDNMGVGTFDKKFKKKEGKLAWLTRDHKVVEDYINDPYCGMMYPVDYYYSLGKTMIESATKNNRMRINKHLELLIVSGADDPVGGFGKGPTKLYEQYQRIGLRCNIILYEYARHECANEMPAVREKFFNDIISFIKKNK